MRKERKNPLTDSLERQVWFSVTDELFVLELRPVALEHANDWLLCERVFCK